MSEQQYMSGEANREVVEGLRAVLADTYVLYFKTHSFHWNVEGVHFKSLHELFEIQYNELWTIMDVIAERIRALDAYAPVNSKELISFATLQEMGQLPDSKEMLLQLANDNHAIVQKTIYPARKAAENAGDEATVDLLTQRIDVHEKAAWMLRSTAK